MATRKYTTNSNAATPNAEKKTRQWYGIVFKDIKRIHCCDVTNEAEENDVFFNL